MTDTETATALQGYTPPMLRIEAAYPTPTNGEVSGLLPGHPEQVVIELSIPEWAAREDPHLSEFVTAIVSSLFRYGAEVPAVSVERQPADGQPSQGRAMLLPNAPTPGGYACCAGEPASQVQPWAAITEDTVATAGAEAA